MTRQSDDPGRGVKLLHDPVRNKGTAFTAAEREALGLRGLLPPRIHTIAEQAQRVLANLRERKNAVAEVRRTCARAPATSTATCS